MAFCIADSPNEPPRTMLRLSGPDGPLARYIVELGAAAEDGWSLDEPHLLRQFSPGESGTVYWFTESGPRCRVIRICGRSLRDLTEILVHLQPLNPGGDPSGAQTVEALCLRGGYQTPDASWAWAPAIKWRNCIGSR